MIVKHGTWIVAADGGGAEVYRNTGHDGVAKLELVESIDPHRSAFTHEADAAKPAHHATHQSGKTSGEAPGYHDQAEHDFAVRLAGHLDSLAGKSPDVPMVLFAAPRFLGMIRPAYSTRLKHTLACETPKDLRQAKIADVEHALAHLK